MLKMAPRRRRTPLTEVRSCGGRVGWKMSPLRVVWFEEDCGACKRMSHRQLHTQTQERDVVRCVMLTEIMGLVCYFVCPELVFAEGQKSRPRTVGMTFRAPEEFLCGIEKIIPGNPRQGPTILVHLCVSNARHRAWIIAHAQ